MQSCRKVFFSWHICFFVSSGPNLENYGSIWYWPKRAFFKKKKKCTKNFTTPYSISFLSVCIKIKLCIIFTKGGQCPIAGHIKGLGLGLIPSADQRSICKLNNYLQMKELYEGWRTIGRLKKCLQVKEVFNLQVQEVSDQISANRRTIYRSKNCLETERLLHWQIEEWSADQKSIQSAGPINICGSKNYLQIQVWSVDWRSIWSADWRTICRLKNCLQIEEVFDLQIEELSADWGIICRWKNRLQTKGLLHW